MKVYSHQFMAMHTRFAMVIPGMESGRGDELAGNCHRIVEDWEDCLSTFRSGAELYLINALAHEREVRLSDPMLRVLLLCSRYKDLTQGLFDPAADMSGSRWGDVMLDPDKQSIRFANPRVRIDPGGIGKGIALEDVVLYLREEGVKNAFLSFGESSIAGMGTHPHGDGWLVGSEDGFRLRDEFLSVSGLQDHHLSGEGSGRAHIFHPLRGELVESIRRVMVKCDSPVEAEVLSTCGYMADNEEFEELEKSFPTALWRME